MFGVFKRQGIAVKFNLVLGLVLVLVVGSTGIYTAQVADQEIQDKSLSELKKLNGTLLAMLDAYNEALQQQAEQSAALFVAQFPNPLWVQRQPSGGLALMHGDELLNNNMTYVDRFSSATKGVATILLRQGDEFVRIATTLKKEDGTRAVGVILSRDHPSHGELMQGKPYTGKATIFGRDWMTRYVPLKNESGQVIGSLAIGLDFTESLKALKQKILTIKIGETGYPYALEASGKNRGSLTLHPAKEGSNLAEAKDSNGKLFVKEMLERRQGVVYYDWQNSGETSPRKKIAVYEHFKAWDWLIASGSYQEEFRREADHVKRNIFFMGAATLLLSMIAVYLVTTLWLSRRLLLLSRASKRVASGDFTLRLVDKSLDEVGQVFASMAVLVDRLSNVIGEVRSNAEHLETAASQVSVTAQTLSQSTTEQASQVEETTRSVEQMTALIQNNSGTAGKAYGVASAAAQRMQDGAQVVQRTTQAMSQIAAKIEIIDEIAYQTNLLALNAAIEAARAGEHGKGFAVVASEVRKLAERSQKAAMEIGRLAGDSVRLAEDAVSKISEVSPLVHAAAEDVATISDASDHQASAAVEMARSIHELDVVVHQNAAASEELAATAEELSGQAVALRDMMSFFQLPKSASQPKMARN